MPETARTPPLGPHNPKEYEELIVTLYECPGKVRGISDFTLENDHLLSEDEWSLISELRDSLPTVADIPTDMNRCLTRSSEFASTDTPVTSARRSGARSAFWQERGVKFKGCRPVSDASDFPIEVLPFGAEKIEYSRISFGVLSAEGVLREILAFCFLTKHDFGLQAKPICIYEYNFGGWIPGYCLVLETKGESRIEQFVEYPDCTIADVIAAQSAGVNIVANAPLGAELNVRSINLWWYVEEKSRFLAAMHFHGGLRGILNSNIGNDVFFRDQGGNPRFYLCDFDTFRLVRVPEKPREGFLKAFALQCIVEVIKGSFSILEYVNLPADCSSTQRAEILGSVYFPKSSLWRSYQRRFFAIARRLGWDQASVGAAFEQAKTIEPVADLLSGCVLNSHYVRRTSRDRGVYYPHN